ncbi:UNVERIFIED_CONTAM: hypothetical protein Sangu_3224300 [Sesamum angustifolium]|uniref:Aminotransferase-like plant mobile domain-containing protein n=1 Tax=Sesamum angustifolium TaxID=2727405 RepID=A0AAW2JI81_9LAMI
MQKWDDDLCFTEEFRYTPKNIGSGLRTCLADVEIDWRHLKIYDVVYALLFTYDHNFDIVKAFCEAWCPLTNTLLTSVGEMSISLWDLHELVGLPMTGCLYDEVVPSALELTGVDEKRERFYPSFLKRISTIRLLVVKRRKRFGLSGLITIHFVYAWLACYFKTHYSVWQELRGPKMTKFSGEGGAKYYEPREARKRIHKAEFFSYACNMLVKAEPFKFVDDGRAQELDHSYFCCNSFELSYFRQGSRFIIEPYSPHRFGHQFGYYQDVPGTLRYDTRVASLEEGLRYWAHEDKVDGGENDPPHALIPPIVIECDSEAAVVEASKGKCSSHNVADSDSSNKDRHWKRQRKEVTPLKATEPDENASRSSLAIFVAELRDEVQSIDVGEESETSHSSTMTPPLGMGLRRKQSSPPAAVSVLKGESFLQFPKRVPSKVVEWSHREDIKYSG